MAKYRKCPRCKGEMKPNEDEKLLRCVKNCGGLVKLPDKVA